MEVKSPVWVLPSDSLVLIPGYTSVLPGCLDLKICFPKISARSKPSMFPEQTEAHHQHLYIMNGLLNRPNRHGPSMPVGLQRCLTLKCYSERMPTAAWNIKYVLLYQKYDLHFALLCNYCFSCQCCCRYMICQKC